MVTKTVTTDSQLPLAYAAMKIEAYNVRLSARNDRGSNATHSISDGIDPRRLDALLPTADSNATCFAPPPHRCGGVATHRKRGRNATRLWFRDGGPGHVESPGPT